MFWLPIFFLLVSCSVFGQTLDQCQSMSERSLARLYGIADGITKERRGKLPAISVSARQELDNTNHGGVGKALKGRWSPDSGKIEIALSTCAEGLGSVNRVMAHELGHAIDFATTNRYYSRSEATLMMSGPPMTVEEAAEANAMLILGRVASMGKSPNIWNSRARQWGVP